MGSPCAGRGRQCSFTHPCITCVHRLRCWGCSVGFLSISNVIICISNIYVYIFKKELLIILLFITVFTSVFEKIPHLASFGAPYQAFTNITTHSWFKTNYFSLVLVFALVLCWKKLVGRRRGWMVVWCCLCLNVWVLLHLWISFCCCCTWMKRAFNTVDI